MTGVLTRKDKKQNKKTKEDHAEVQGVDANQAEDLPKEPAC